MAVYNPPKQVLFNPVSNYYQGKAIRQQLEAAEVDTELRRKQTEALQMEIDSAPAAAEAARRKEERAAQKAADEHAKALRSLSEGEREDVRNANQAAFDVLDGGGTIPEATEAFKISADEAPNTPRLSGIPDDWQFNPDVAAAQNAIFAEEDTPSDYTLAPGSARFNEYDDRVAFNPKTPDTTIDLRDLGYLAENFEKKSIQKFVDSDYTDPTLLDPLLDPKDAKDAEEINTRIDASTAIIDEAVTLADNWTTGFPGYIKRVMETGEAYLDPNAEQPAKDFAEKLMFLQATNWREIVGSGQLSGADYTFLDGLFKGKGFGDDPVATKRSLNLLKDWLIGKKAVSGTVSTGQKYKEGDVADGPDGPLIYQNEEWVPYAE